MSDSNPYTLKELLGARDRVISSLSARASDILMDRKFHDCDWLKQECRNRGIRIKYSDDLPGEGKAALLNVDGTKFLIVKKQIEHNLSGLALALAHELSHALLNHMKNTKFVALGYSGLLAGWTSDLQVSYFNRIELEADLGAMSILMTDAYLEATVEKSVFIPVRKIARERNLSTKWVAARVQLFRKIYGYDRSRKLLMERHSDRVWKPDPNRWFSGMELNDTDWLSKVIKRAGTDTESLMITDNAPALG